MQTMRPHLIFLIKTTWLLERGVGAIVHTFKTINICLAQKALGYHSLEAQQLVTAQQLCMLQSRGPTAMYVSPNCGEKLYHSYCIYQYEC